MPIRTREVVVVNKAQCRLCGDIVESKHRHGFVRCMCGEIFVDGGKSYIRRGASDLNNIIELSETYEETYESDW
jgi:tRNA(Ile2) C34 agmatinyltransferase TiaS